MLPKNVSPENTKTFRPDVRTSRFCEILAHYILHCTWLERDKNAAILENAERLYLNLCDLTVQEAWEVLFVNCCILWLLMWLKCRRLVWFFFFFLVCCWFIMCATLFFSSGAVCMLRSQSALFESVRTETELQRPWHCEMGALHQSQRILWNQSSINPPTCLLSHIP